MRPLLVAMAVDKLHWELPLSVYEQTKTFALSPLFLLIPGALLLIAAVFGVVMVLRARNDSGRH